MSKKHIRDGRGALRPYLFVCPDMIDFVQDVFGAQITARYDSPNGSHVEAVLEDTPFVLEAADSYPEHINVSAGSVYLYVKDVDATYQKAIEAGAKSIAAPEDKPYDERGCGIEDLAGNTWWIATHNDASS